MSDIEVLENELIRLHELLVLPTLDSETRNWVCRSIDHILNSIAPIPIYHAPLNSPIIFN